eukprot:TRINITY_DN9359_c0_g1_i27.p2 TRINITY_DN9359_c0_g1~~TRINITY_DN9359_c0_g1_i27.p2  ORF type:complete len:107 (-),score=26.65 TRINITY_DN9359_c0_g1_i27:88-408(-)
MGLSQMAITGAVSEPLFSTLLGFGISMIKSTTKGPLTFSVDKRIQAVFPLVGICMCLGGLLCFFLYNWSNGFHIKRVSSMIQLSMYAFFLGILVVLMVILPSNNRN